MSVATSGDYAQRLKTCLILILWVADASRNKFVEPGRKGILTGTWIIDADTVHENKNVNWIIHVHRGHPSGEKQII